MQRLQIANLQLGNHCPAQHNLDDSDLTICANSRPQATMRMQRLTRR